MAEEIVRQMRNLWELYDTIQQIYPDPNHLRTHSLPGHQTFLVQEGGEEELRQYRIVDFALASANDADGNEIKWPLKLVSNTRIVI